MSKPRILIAEDERIVAEDIKISLERFGYAISSITSSGEETVKKAQEEKPDLILMDIVLAGELDGIEAAQQIRERLSIPVVFLTAYADDRLLMRAKITEPYSYMLKPFEERELYATIEMALSKHAIEMKLIESEEKYRSFVENFQGIAFRGYENFSVDFFTGRVKEITGYSEDDFVSGRIRFDQLIHPEDKQQVQDDVTEFMSSPKRATQREYRIIDRNGKTHWTQEYAQKFYDEDKGRTGIYGTYNDTTKRKQAEEALRESEAQKRAILDGSIDRIRLVDKDMRIIWANKTTTRELNIAPEDLMGHPCYRISFDRNAPCDECPSKKALETGQIEHAVVHQPYLKGIEGETYWDNYSVPIKNESGDIVNLIQITRNITEQVRAEKRLRSSQEELRNLATHLQSVREQERTNIAREIHDELAQALTALRMDISWLSKKLSKDQETLLDKTKAMTKLTDVTIKTVKRISTELRPGLLDDLGLVAAIEWQAEEFQSRTGIKCKLTADPEDIAEDEKRSTALFRIFQETLTNITRHAKATNVKISLKEKDGTFELKVRDNGKGITKEQISDPKSFGLMGIRERAITWGGEVKISGRPGKGTTVLVNLPIK